MVSYSALCCRPARETTQLAPSSQFSCGSSPVKSRRWLGSALALCVAMIELVLSTPRVSAQTT